MIKQEKAKKVIRESFIKKIDYYYLLRCKMFSYPQSLWGLFEYHLYISIYLSVSINSYFMLSNVDIDLLVPWLLLCFCKRKHGSNLAIGR